MPTLQIVLISHNSFSSRYVTSTLEVISDSVFPHAIIFLFYLFIFFNALQNALATLSLSVPRNHMTDS